MNFIENANDLRSWIILVFTSVSVIISARVYFQNQAQRRLENSLRILGMFKESIDSKDREEWERLFHATSDSSGAPLGFLMTDDGPVPLSDLFTEGPPDKGAVQRMLDFFESIVSFAEEETIDLQFTYYQIGHYMESIRGWVQSFPDSNGNDFLKENYPGFEGLFSKGLIKKSWKYAPRAITG